MNMLRLLVGFGLFVVVQSCGSPPFLPVVCTEIGCDDGLTVIVADAPAGPYSVELVLPGGERRAAECPEASRCEAGFFFAGVAAREVAITVTSSAGARTITVRPTYTASRPNGRGCPPLCRQGTVKISLRG